MIVGIDVSSKQINLAWMSPAGRPQRWSQRIEQKTSDKLITRLRRIHIEWPGEDVTHICVEMPYSHRKTAISALMATVGVITHQAPSYARVEWISTGKIRTALGCTNKKQATHDVINNMTFGPWTHALMNWSADDLDALAVCLGYQRILAAQDAE